MDQYIQDILDASISLNRAEKIDILRIVRQYSPDLIAVSNDGSRINLEKLDLEVILRIYSTITAQFGEDYRSSDSETEMAN